MNALILSYKRGRHVIHPRHAIIKIDGIEDRAKAQALVGNKVSYATPGGKILNGIVSKPHGGKGLVIARFETGLPGQCFGSQVSITEKETKKETPKKTTKK